MCVCVFEREREIHRVRETVADTLQGPHCVCVRVCVCTSPLSSVPPSRSLFVSVFVNETVSEGACGARLMCTAGVAVSAENGPSPLPNDATSILDRRAVGMCVCVCVRVCP